MPRCGVWEHQRRPRQRAMLSKPQPPPFAEESSLGIRTVSIQAPSRGRAWAEPNCARAAKRVISRAMFKMRGAGSGVKVLEAEIRRLCLP